MTSGLRLSLAEKIAGEICLSENPGPMVRKWRTEFSVSQGQLAVQLRVSPSVISDYESGRRKSPGTPFVAKIVETLLAIDESRGGNNIRKFGSLLACAISDDVVLDIQEYSHPVRLDAFISAIDGERVCGETSQTIYGYTVVNSMNAIMNLSAEEFSRIYGWSTARALIFTGVSTGKSPLVAIRVTPFKPRLVVLQGLAREGVHAAVVPMAERDRITVAVTECTVSEVISKLRSAWKWQESSPTGSTYPATGSR